MQLQIQEQQAKGLLEEVRVMACVAIPQSLQGLAADGVRLQESICEVHQHITEKREQAERDIKALDRYWYGIKIKS